jgi:hypothetical protein
MRRRSAVLHSPASVMLAGRAALCFRRAESSELLFGGPRVYHQRLLDRLGI